MYERHGCGRVAALRGEIISVRPKGLQSVPSHLCFTPDDGGL